MSLLRTNGTSLTRILISLSACSWLGTACGGKTQGESLLPDESTTDDQENDTGTSPDPSGVGGSPYRDGPYYYDDMGSGGAGMGGESPGMDGGSAGNGSIDPEACVDSCDQEEQCLSYLDEARCLKVCELGLIYSVTTQDEVEELGARNCQALDGSLTISGPSITSLAPLDDLVLIGGSLNLSAIAHLNASDGFSALKVVTSSLIVTGSPELEDLGALSSLRYVGEDLHISGNEKLESLEALSDVEFGEGQLMITSNSALTSLAGLEGIVSRNATTIASNAMLEDVSGLESLAEVTQILQIASNFALEGFELGSLKSIDGVFSFTGNPVSKEVSCPLLSEVTQDLVVAGNDGLLSVAFENLANVGNLSISGNPSLTSVGELSSLENVEGNMIISGNESLPQCEVDAIDARIQACAPCVDNDDSASCN